MAKGRVANAYKEEKNNNMCRPEHVTIWKDFRKQNIEYGISVDNSVPIDKRSLLGTK